MSTPKIKVYRLDKGYNQDADNDIQTRINSELLPFVEKKSKPTDAYYLTAVSEQKIQWNGEKINSNSFTESYIFSNGECTIKGCVNWIKNGFYRPRLGYVSDGIFYEIVGEYDKEEKILNIIEGEEESEFSYLQKENFLYAHPFVFSKKSKLSEKPTEEFEFDESTYYVWWEENGNITFKINVAKILEEFGNVITDTTEESDSGEISNTNSISLSIKHYEIGDGSDSIYLENYPIYNHNNYFFNPQIFTPNKIVLKQTETETETETGTETGTKPINRCFDEVECDDDWIFYGNGSPLVTYRNIVLEKKDYEFIYSFVDGTRKMIVKISEDFLTPDQVAEDYALHYNTNKTLLMEGYELDSNTGKIKFTKTVPENFFVYYYQKVQASDTFISENVNWSFGHLRENPDIFYGEEDYPGDEEEDKDTGTPLYSGMKPSFVSSGYQIDYFRGCVNFTDGKKWIYKSDTLEKLEYRDKNYPETFVRANYSYYPEIHGVFRQKMESVDGYVFKSSIESESKSDFRYQGSFKKRWIMKADNYQPMFFENFTDKINVCSQYKTTAPNYDKLERKDVIKILKSDDSKEKESKLTFILPLIESKFIVFSGFDKDETLVDYNITFKNESEELEKFELKSEVIDEKEVFYINEQELSQGEISEIGETVKIKFAYLSSQLDDEIGKSISFELISAEVINNSI